MKNAIYLDLLKQLIEIPSFSGEENGTAEVISNFITNHSITVARLHNNIIVRNKHWDNRKENVLLNSHHDTVKPNNMYQNNPFQAIQKENKLFGLGSNDAGLSLVCLLAAFLLFYDKKDLAYNLIFVASAEEENSGPKGLKSVLQHTPPVSCAIIGEPTNLEMAIAEKGLLVIDAHSKGIPGHAAHNNTINPIYTAVEDIRWLKSNHDLKESPNLGKVKISVTQIAAGEQHNCVPDSCHFTIDVRTNECYSNEQIYYYLNENTKSELIPRSLNLNASSISSDHPLVIAGKKLGIKSFASTTLSDQANLSCPSIKIGPGKSERSHQADEFIELDELNMGIETYYKLLNTLL